MCTHAQTLENEICSNSLFDILNIHTRQCTYRNIYAVELCAKLLCGYVLFICVRDPRPPTLYNIILGNFTECVNIERAVLKIWYRIKTFQSIKLTHK